MAGKGGRGRCLVCKMNRVLAYICVYVTLAAKRAVNRACGCEFMSRLKMGSSEHREDQTNEEEGDF